MSKPSEFTIIINLIWVKAADRVDQRLRFQCLICIDLHKKSLFHWNFFQLVIHCKFSIWRWVSQYSLQVGVSVFAHFSFSKETVIFLLLCCSNFEFFEFINARLIRNIIFFTRYSSAYIFYLFFETTLRIFYQRLCQRSTKFCKTHLQHDLYEYESLLAKFVSVS